MKRLLLSLLVPAVACACVMLSKSKEECSEGFTTMQVPADIVIPEGANDTIYLGGFGSSLAYDREDSIFYLLTDRGPNVDGVTSESKVFPLPEYSPTVAKYKVVDGKLQLVDKIILREVNGTPFVGLPNQKGDGVTGEVAYNMAGDIVNNTKRGIDSEGIALAPDGSFWISDEYAPFLLCFDKDGVLKSELSPSNGLPKYYANRRPNRGMEGVAISHDGKKLYGAMQSPLYLPNSSTKNSSINNRILELDIETGATREFIYQLEDPKLMVSDICFLTDSTMLVLERDGKFPSDNYECTKRIYKINISEATDVSYHEIEPLSTKQLLKSGIYPVKKELVVDIIKAIPNYSHDKPEGIAMVSDSVLAIVNDDDFGVIDNGNGGYAPKLDSEGDIDRSSIYFVNIGVVLSCSSSSAHPCAF